MRRVLVFCGGLAGAIFVAQPVTAPLVPNAAMAPAQQALAPTSCVKSPKRSFFSHLHPFACWEAIASWYGKEFEGKPTANGETFDTDALTAAHPSLPLGSILKLSNPQSGQSLLVRVNDRGPYYPGRGLDVSLRVARLLGFAEQGVARIKVEVLKLPKQPWPKAPPPTLPPNKN